MRTIPGVGDIVATTIYAVMPTIAGEDVCRAEVTRLVTIETPEVCAIEGESRSRVLVRAKAPGTCRIRAALPGDALATVLELEVMAPAGG